MKLKTIIKLIEADIKHQEEFLGTGHDESINWRITGMKDLKEKIFEAVENE